MAETGVGPAEVCDFGHTVHRSVAQAYEARGYEAQVYEAQERSYSTSVLEAADSRWTAGGYKRVSFHWHNQEQHQAQGWGYDRNNEVLVAGCRTSAAVATDVALVQGCQMAHCRLQRTTGWVFGCQKHETKAGEQAWAKCAVRCLRLDVRRQVEVTILCASGVEDVDHLVIEPVVPRRFRY